jgi:HAD superfamily hydrolase (TIGR01490 family)
MEAAFFDLDKTVIAKASMVAFGRPFYDEGLISRRHVVRALWGQLVFMHLGASEQKLARIRESVLRLTRGWEQERVRRIVRETLEVVVEPIVYAEAEELIAWHQAEGRRVYLVSASPSELVEPLADYLRVDGAIASTARVDEAGRYTGEMAFYAYGPYKAEAMQALAQAEGIDLERSYSYSDSYTDAPMLEVVGHPVAVNPDRVLRKLAEERGWEIRTFSRPVPLREQGAPRPSIGRATAAMAGAGVLVGAGVATAAWWRVRHRAPPPPAPPAALIRRAASWPRQRQGRRGWRAGGASS